MRTLESFFVLLVFSILSSTLVFATSIRYCEGKLTEEQVENFKNNVLVSKELLEYSSFEFVGISIDNCAFPEFTSSGKEFIFPVTVFYKTPQDFSSYGINYKLVVNIEAYSNGSFSVPIKTSREINELIRKIESAPQVSDFIENVERLSKMEVEIDIKNKEGFPIFGGKVEFDGDHKDFRFVNLEYNYIDNKIESFNIPNILELKTFPEINKIKSIVTKELSEYKECDLSKYRTNYFNSGDNFKRYSVDFEFDYYVEQKVGCPLTAFTDVYDDGTYKFDVTLKEYKVNYIFIILIIIIVVVGAFFVYRIFKKWIK